MVQDKDALAVFGGTPAKTVPYGRGQRFGKAEEEAAAAVIRSGHLWSKRGGTRVPALEKTICELWRTPHAIACSSGTAAVHTALIMCGVEAGDEVIVNPITDWGSVCGILAIGAVPVFADIHPDTLSLDPAAVAQSITSRTRAILLVHQAGYPAHAPEIVALAKQRGLMVVEDAAQSPLALLNGQAVGTFGDAAAFSANDSKHVSCGEGGFVITGDADMAQIARLFIDKGYGQNKARGQTDVHFLGFNYRLSDLAAAVLEVQLRGLEEQIRRRTAFADRLAAALHDLPGFRLLPRREGTRPAYWFVVGCLDPQRLSADRATISAALSAEGLACWPALAPTAKLYATTALRNRQLFPGGRTAPAAFLAGQTWDPAAYPVTEHVASSVLSFPLDPFYTAQDADETAHGIRKVIAYYLARP